MKHADVTGHLNEITNLLESVVLPSPSEESWGENDLRLTKEWLKREREVCQMLEEYKKSGTEKCWDTHANIDFLREQDESITYQFGPVR
nr:DUF5344 family protein [Metabacillus mangrovi]